MISPDQVEVILNQIVSDQGRIFEILKQINTLVLNQSEESNIPGTELVPELKQFLAARDDEREMRFESSWKTHLATGEKLASLFKENVGLLNELKQIKAASNISIEERFRKIKVRFLRIAPWIAFAVVCILFTVALFLIRR